jgi:hypothetical protein
MYVSIYLLVCYVCPVTNRRLHVCVHLCVSIYMYVCVGVSLSVRALLTAEIRCMYVDVVL